MDEIIRVERRGARIEINCLSHHDEAFSSAYADARAEVKDMPKHAQLPYVRAALKALREEERHLEEGQDDGYDAELMRRRSQRRAEADRTGRKWRFDEEEEMQAAGFDAEEIRDQVERRAERVRMAARRAACEVLSACLARWGRLPKAGEVDPRHSYKNNKTWDRRRRAVATILLLWDADAQEYVRRPGWADGYARELFKKVAKEPTESHLSGEDPANSIEDYFRRKLCKSPDEDFPVGGDMEGWFKLARKWAEDVPKGRFDPK